MGAAVEITTDAPGVAVEAALAVVRTLELRCSRFLPDSELNLLNGADGPALARPSTARLIEIALAGSRLTQGWFDPTRGAELSAAGYRRSLSHGWGSVEPVAARAGTTDPDDGAIMAVDALSGLVDVPSGVQLDLGGIAKGWAADVAVALLRDAGASHAGVSVGGDVRVGSDTRVLVEVVAPADSTERSALVGLGDGGIAVSGATRRRTEDGRHHLIDPFTGLPARRPRTAAVVAASAAGAEMLATAAAIAPIDEAVAIIEAAGATAWLVEASSAQDNTARDSAGDASGAAVIAVGDPDRYLVEAGWLR